MHESHILFTSDDFTSEEIELGENIYAKMIDYYDLSVCMNCGKYAADLDEPCKIRLWDES